MSNKQTGNIRGPAPGRPVGSVNKITGNVKNMILCALDTLGGEQWLVEQARLEPRAFMALLGRVLPTEVSLDASITSLDRVTEIRRTIIDPRAIEQELP